jgi:putative endonuclease
MPGSRKLGSEAEDQAAEFLLREGYSLLGRRLKLPSGEIDVAAYEGDLLVIVEVKSTLGDYAPESRITDKKIARLAKATREFVATYDLRPNGIRFDVIVVSPRGIDHFKSAYEDSSRDE